MKPLQPRVRLALTIASGLALLGACTSTDPVYTQFYREAGDVPADSEFGKATRGNMLIQTGQQGYSHAIATRFAAEVPSTVNFAFNSAALDANAQAALREQANWIRQFPEVRFRVYGYTDLVGSAGYNKSLGLRRAQAVVAFLTSQGISRSRLEAVVSYGETQPVIATPAPERRNRRAVTEVNGFVASHRNVLDGKYALIVYRGYVESARVPSTLSGVENGVAGDS
ncbi:OmpA family protein [Sulfitobacter sp. LCG007]